MSAHAKSGVMKVNWGGVNMAMTQAAAHWAQWLHLCTLCS